MSIDTCSDCGDMVDTDDDPGCYLGNKCVCERCHEKYLCPECGSDETFEQHHEATFAAPECDYKACGECGHQWGHG